MSDNAPKTDLVLPPGSFAYMQDLTKGGVKTYTGPIVVNKTTQERPVIYDPKSNTFRGTNTLEEATQVAPIAAEGYYIILRNPARGNKHPDEGGTQPNVELEIGRAIVVPGPATFALWPGQFAEVVKGHHLRSNQYLLVRVYNEEAAQGSWGKAVIKPATENPDGTPLPTSVTTAPPPDLTVGKLLIIRGTEVSFYIPPTGIEVVREAGSDYAREALTLERLEYAILVDENGKKRYEIGPKVVFPLPTERFIEARDDSGQMNKKFRAIELNELQGIHVKVIADYDEGGVKRRTGDELFITGEDTAIYFPREEHSAINYDGRVKHFATAIPAGEARYVMNRLTGEISTVAGPAMLLPDPRSEVIVRRVLSDRECSLWYPNNVEALSYNQSIRTLMHSVPTTRQGVVSEGDFERGRTRSARNDSSKSVAGAAHSVMESSRVGGDQRLIAEEFSRASTYTQPRTITLDNKYQGVPQISPWTGYAVLVTSKTGKRRVEIGPVTVLLDYDEGIEPMKLSTGKPKTTDNLLETPYLRVENNQVSDILQVETSDHVVVEVKLSYRVNFEGDPLKWFSVENYVKFLCDHVRSVLKGQVRRMKIEDFYAASTDIIRDAVLGKNGEGKDGKRTGMIFAENGMRIFDVEVLKVTLNDQNIRQMLDNAQLDVVRSNIDLSTARRSLEVIKQKQEIARATEQEQATTAKTKHTLQIELAASELGVALARAANDLRQITEEVEVRRGRLALTDLDHDSRLQRERKEAEQIHAMAVAEQGIRIQLLKAEAESIVARFQAAQGGFSEALLALSHNETLVQVAKAWDVQRTIAGDTLADTLARLFEGTPLKPLVEKLTTPTNGIGKSTQPTA